MTCDLPGCDYPATWWTCHRCGSHTCRRHQAFTGAIVASCSLCEARRPIMTRLLAWVRGKTGGAR